MSSPTDYYSVLRRATSALDPNTEEARRALYDRARQAIVDADLSPAQAANESSALEAAIARIEMQARVPPPLPPLRSTRPPRATEDGGRPAAQPRKLGLSPAMLAALATAVVLIMAVGGYWLLLGVSGPDRSDPGLRADIPAAPAAPAAKGQPERAADGGKGSGRSFIFNRQMVYYRTIHPVGTIVIAKSQRFLYLVRENVAAMRYTIGVGRECVNVVGLLLVSAKEDWPDTTNQQASAQVQRAMPRSRFGLRSLALADTGHRIHGTYAPTTAGDDGCFVLINDDIVDLYERVPVGTRVVIN